MTEVIIAVVSVLLGAGFDRALGVYLEGRSEKEQLARVRILLALEIERNLSEVRRVQDEITMHAEENEAQLPESQRDLRKVSRLLTLPWPRWTRTAWEGQAALIPAALSSAQITRIHRLHTSLDSLTAIRDTLVRLDAEEQERKARLTAQYDGAVPMMMAFGRFDHIAPSLWAQYVRTTGEVLDAGNALESALTSGDQRSLPKP